MTIASPAGVFPGLEDGREAQGSSRLHDRGGGGGCDSISAQGQRLFGQNRPITSLNKGAAPARAVRQSHTWAAWRAAATLSPWGQTQLSPNFIKFLLQTQMTPMIPSPPFSIPHIVSCLTSAKSN